MKTKLTWTLAWTLLLTSAAWAQKDAPSAGGTATKPEPRAGGWMMRHESFNNRVKQGNVDLLFIGDSITQGWEGAGKEAWAKYYGKRNAVNLGVGGDRTGFFPGLLRCSRTGCRSGGCGSDGRLLRDLGDRGCDGLHDLSRSRA